MIIVILLALLVIGVIGGVAYHALPYALQGLWLRRLMRQHSDALNEAAKHSISAPAIADQHMVRAEFLMKAIQRGRKPVEDAKHFSG